MLAREAFLSITPQLLFEIKIILVKQVIYLSGITNSKNCRNIYIQEKM